MSKTLKGTRHKAQGTTSQIFLKMRLAGFFSNLLAGAPALWSALDMALAGPDRQRRIADKARVGGGEAAQVEPGARPVDQLTMDTVPAESRVHASSY